MEKELQKFYLQKSSKKLLFFFPSQINFCLRARKNKLKTTRCHLLLGLGPPGFPSLLPRVSGFFSPVWASKDTLLQGFLLPEHLTLAGCGSHPSIYLPALLGPSLPPGQLLGMRRVSKKWVLGDTGRAYFFMLWGVAGCGVRPTPGCEVAGMLTSLFPLGSEVLM